ERSRGDGLDGDKPGADHPFLEFMEGEGAWPERLSADSSIRRLLGGNPTTKHGPVRPCRGGAVEAAMDNLECPNASPAEEDTHMHAIFSGVSVIPVLTIDRERDAVPLARALFEGGLPVIEVTMRTAAAGAVIAAIRRELPQVIVGAGTLLRAADIATAIQAGAGFLVSPGLTPELAAAALAAELPYLPRVAPPSAGLAARAL